MTTNEHPSGVDRGAERTSTGMRSSAASSLERAQDAEGAPRFFSVAQVAEMLGMAPVTLYRAIRAGQFPAVRIRGRLIIPAKVVDAFVEAAVADAAAVQDDLLLPEGASVPAPRGSWR